MARWQGGNSIPPPERGRSTGFASLRRECCPVGVRRLARAFGDHRGLELTPTRLPPNKSGVADLPLSGGGIAELAAPLRSPTRSLRLLAASARPVVPHPGHGILRVDELLGQLDLALAQKRDVVADEHRLQHQAGVDLEVHGVEDGLPEIASYDHAD